MNLVEMERLAAAVNRLRPDWPIDSLLTGISGTLADLSWRDATVAMAWVATDPETRTPGRVNQPGPWWDATAITATPPAGTTPSAGRGPHCQHCHRPHHQCQSKTVQTYDPHEFTVTAPGPGSSGGPIPEHLAAELRRATGEQQATDTGHDLDEEER